jgi:hypothetical protein
MPVASVGAADHHGAGRISGGPVLAGERVAWAERGAHALTVRGWKPGAAPVPIARYGDFSGNYPGRARLAASSEALVVERISSSPRGAASGNDWAGRDVFAGPPDGPLANLSGTCPPIFPALPRTVDVSGDEVLSINCDDQAVVRDLSSGSDQPIPASQYGLRLAGRYAAWVERGSGGESVVVYDRTAASVAYETAVGSGSIVRDLDLQADGTIAFAYARTGERASVGWASLSEPETHTTALPQTPGYHVKIANGRIGFITGHVVGRDVARARIGYVDVASGRVRTVATGAEDDADEERFDFDGQRFAWYSLGCTEAIVHVTPANTHQRAVRRGCQLRLDRAPTVRDGRVAIEPDCSLFAGGYCSRIRRVRVRHHRALVASGREAGDVRLTPHGRTLLHADGRLPVRITATLGDDAGRREQRSTSAVLERR